MRPSHARAGEQGFALIAVLGFLMLLAIFLTPFATSARLYALLSDNELQNKRLEQAAEAINRYFIWRLSIDPDWKSQADRGGIDIVGCQIADTDILMSIIPHARLININTADTSLLAAGLNDLGIDLGSASALARDIVAFRSPRSEDVSGEQIQSGLKRAPFEDISELYDFRDLQGVPMSALTRKFSPWAGRSLAAKPDDAPQPSQYYTMTTRIVSPTSSGQDAAVFMAGGSAQQPGTRISPIVQDLDGGTPKRVTSCDDLLGPKAATILQEAGL